ncbi:FAD-binding protein [bacterium SCSIO 12643]|nr:FAD-binding protein [bacterium SCSIO 12643]
MIEDLEILSSQLQGEFHTDAAVKIIYATDASAYREIPLAVAIPKSESDIQKLIQFAQKNKVSLIPRTAGTSLAGQVVGSGIVVDVSKYFTSILELNTHENWVRVEPGVIRDELNYFLKPKGFLFGPETSTSNRAMIGGMIGNNSCGSNSIVYGSTRDHLLEVKAFLSDGSQVVFKELDANAFQEKLALPEDNLEGNIYRHIYHLLGDSSKRSQIKANYPKPEIKRRNTGYALDILMQSEVFNEGTGKFNFCNLIAGSEGTLAFITEIKIGINPLPPSVQGLLVGHYTSVNEALKANLIALKYHPYAVELMDHHILECTKDHPLYSRYRFFIQGDPQALLAIQLHADSNEELEQVADDIRKEMNQNNYGYHFPLVTSDISKVWALRKAGLGLLANIPGDEKAVPVIEDTCVSVEDLPDYIEEFNLKLKERNLSCVHYAHAGSGELHLRPMINLKTEEGNQLFRTVAQDIADLVQKHKGSLSGEHGDGRLRGEFISQMVGKEIYDDFKRLKNVWDPNGVFNPGKIVNSPSMNTQLRYAPGQNPKPVDTVFDFSKHNGFLESVELCNGSADCRKTELTGGTMCPSYMATRDEMYTTRSRANLLRELMTQREERAFSSPELNQSMELCLMCKGCQQECPSNVDMATYKSEYLYQKSLTEPISFAKHKMAHFSDNMKLAQNFYPISNWVVDGPLKNWVKKQMGIAKEREIPMPQKQSLFQWYKINHQVEKTKWLKSPIKKVLFFCDEFTNYLDVQQGVQSLQLLWALGYDAEIIQHRESGRTAISKGFLKLANELANENTELFYYYAKSKIPIIGIEPSTLLTFRDEYPKLVKKELQSKANINKEHSFLIDEFIANEFDQGHISSELFNDSDLDISLHGHCHQKALSSITYTKKMLSIPSGYKVSTIPSGCCGMAGSFGYEHYDVSMKIGELVLFPTIRNKNEKTVVAAPGTSCRHQIKDGVNETAYHPVELLFKALK